MRRHFERVKGPGGDDSWDLDATEGFSCCKILGVRNSDLFLQSVISFGADFWMTLKLFLDSHVVFLLTEVILQK